MQDPSVKNLKPQVLSGVRSLTRIPGWTELDGCHFAIFRRAGQLFCGRSKNIFKKP
jgi:hypothetical protein